MKPEQLLRGLKNVKRKRLKNPRLGTVSGFLSRMGDVCGVDEIASYLKSDPAKFHAAVKRAAGQFTYFDEKHAAPAYMKFKGDDGKLVVKGQALKDDEAGKSLGDGFLMEFDCVITTGRRDRDGDVLDPKGAMVDPKMPLLWQHMPFQPVGKMVRLLEQSEDKVTGRFAIVDTPLGREAAQLVKTGCLRISHGFAPIEYNPLKDENGKDMGGWNISRYAMMEASLVSIPSNVDAEIEQFNAGKFHDPLLKAFFKGLTDPAKRKAYSLGWGSALPRLKAAGKKADGKEDEDEDKRKEDEEDDREEKADDDEEEEEEDDEEEGEKEGEEEDEGEDEEGGDEDGDGDSGESDSDSGASEDGGQMRPLGEIIDGINQLAADQSLPKEAQRRLAVVAGMFEDVEENIGQCADTIGEAAKTRDLCTMFTAMAEMTETCVAHIGRAAEELERVVDVPELPDGAKGEIGQAVEEARGIMNAVGMMTAAAEDAEDESGTDVDGDGEEGEDEGFDEADGEPEPAEAEEDDEDDEEEEGDEEYKEEDEDDREEKEEDDEDTEEKGDTDDQDEDDGEENPEAYPAGGENPGVNDGRATTPAGRRRLSLILGKQLCGMDLTPRERKMLREHADELPVDDE